MAWFASVLVLLAMWIYFALKILLLSRLTPEPKAFNKLPPRGFPPPSTSSTPSRPATSGGEGPEGMGAGASLCRFRRPRRHRRPRVRRAAAAPVGGLAHGRGDAARDPVRRPQARARHGVRTPSPARPTAAASRRRRRPTPRSRRSPRARLPTRPPMCAATIRNGSTPSLPPCSARTAPRRARRAASRAPVDLRVNTLKGERATAAAARSRISMRRRRRGRRSACASPSARRRKPADPGRAGFHRRAGRGPGRRLAARGNAVGGGPGDT